MCELNFLYNMLKFFASVGDLLNCGNSIASFIPTILYSIGCFLTCLVIYSYHSQYSTRLQENVKMLILRTLLCGVFFWIGVVFVVKTAALKIVNQGHEAEMKNNQVEAVRITVTFCSLVAICPNIAASYLYITYKQHLRLIEQLDNLIRTIQDNRTEIGNRNQIHDMQNLERRRQFNLPIRKRSCPNLSKNF